MFRVILLLALATCTGLAGCAAEGGSRAGGASSRNNAPLGDALEPDLADAEWGEIPSSRSGDSALATGRRGSAVQPFSESHPWTIVLTTIAGDDAEYAATQVLQTIRQTVPELAAARVVPTPRGAMIAYGAYADVREEQAQTDLAWVKGLASQRRRPFANAVMTRVPPSAMANVVLHPHDLRAVRRMYPKVDPMYTLQVAVWSDFESGTLTPQQVMKNAEQQAAQLRLQGHDAYFHHDSDKQTSIVTVGLFDKRAVMSDPRLNTPVFSDEVEALFKKFPAHLVNGESIMEPDVRGRPDLGMHVQRPRLVIVPLM
jgi:hypothetical protein